jgi:CRISPR-associated endonuclease/helicase Cas3
MTFESFFQRAAGNIPFPYQRRLAEEGTLPDLLHVPTGVGKTAAVILAWLWRRRCADPATRQSTPRRLIYCLPMRVLVEQTHDVAVLCLDRLGLLAGKADLGPDSLRAYEPKPDDPRSSEHGPRIAVHVLMGGEAAEEWDLYPERDAMVIGTQDMLLSRALNRGYGMSRYRWPMHFGLLNNDCLWVFDEVQLMGVGVETSAQLQAFRDGCGTFGPCWSLWMSATLGQAQLETIDHPRPAVGWHAQTLQAQDYAEVQIQQRVQAQKPIAQVAGLSLTKDNEKRGYADALAVQIAAAHRPDSLTLVVVNRVNRAQELYRALLKHPGRSPDNTALIHSRFREMDRRAHESILRDQTDRIVVATQAIEAGVDISARTMFTELAPWPALVQRCGRCNRYGEYADARIYWIDLDITDEKDPKSLPYSFADLGTARNLLLTLDEANPANLATVPYTPPAVVRPVLRRPDLLDLFDTTADLSGNDLDVSRYIRETDDTDVRVYWRDVPETGPTQALPQPVRQELCSVSVVALNTFLQRLRAAGPLAWYWDPLEAQWHRVTRGRPGQTLLFSAAAGAYDPQLGWTGLVAKKNQMVPEVELEPSGTAIETSMDEDPETAIGCWVSLPQHLDDVASAARVLADTFGLSNRWASVLETAAFWHDLGKAHPVFQDMLRQPGQHDPSLMPPSLDILWAKSNHNRGRASRKYFRHELASALAWFQMSDANTEDVNLIAYLIAAHHGKIRLVLRSLPGETEPEEPERLYARGVWDGEILPALTLLDGTTIGPFRLDLSLMRLGQGSWLERMLRLRDDVTLGPFRLAWLEMLLRVADWRASAAEQRVAVAPTSAR